MLATLLAVALVAICVPMCLMAAGCGDMGGFAMPLTCEGLYLPDDLPTAMFQLVAFAFIALFVATVAPTFFEMRTLSLAPVAAATPHPPDDPLAGRLRI